MHILLLAQRQIGVRLYGPGAVVECSPEEGAEIIASGLGEEYGGAAGEQAVNSVSPASPAGAIDPEGFGLSDPLSSDTSSPEARGGPASAPAPAATSDDGVDLSPKPIPELAPKPDPAANGGAQGEESGPDDESLAGGASSPETAADPAAPQSTTGEP